MYIFVDTCSPEQSCGSEMIFFPDPSFQINLDPDPDPTFQIISDPEPDLSLVPDPDWDPT